MTTTFLDMYVESWKFSKNQVFIHQVNDIKEIGNLILYGELIPILSSITVNDPSVYTKEPYKTSFIIHYLQIYMKHNGKKFGKNNDPIIFNFH